MQNRLCREDAIWGKRNFSSKYHSINVQVFDSPLDKGHLYVAELGFVPNEGELDR